MTEKKNICITINSLAPGGAEKQCLLLAKALKPYHNPFVVILKPRPVDKKHLKVLEEEELNHIFLTNNTIKRAFEFTSFLKKRNIDIIFSFLPMDTIWGGICGRAAGVPYVFGGIRSSYLPWIKSVSLRLINNYLLNYTIANNYTAYYSGIKSGFKNKILVVPNGIEIRQLPQRKKLDGKTITIISVGRLVKSKAYETAIKCIAELKKVLKKNQKVIYKIVGQGPELTSIFANIEKYDVKEEVEIITDTSNVYKLLESSDIYLSTTTFEGISNAIMEAMNCGLPLVVTDAGDNSLLVRNGQNGFLTAINDYEDMAAHLYHLIETPAMRHQMGLESYDHLVKNFSYTAFQDKYLKLIEHIDSIRINNGDPLLPNWNSLNME